MKCLLIPPSWLIIFCKHSLLDSLLCWLACVFPTGHSRLQQPCTCQRVLLHPAYPSNRRSGMWTLVTREQRGLTLFCLADCDRTKIWEMKKWRTMPCHRSKLDTDQCSLIVKDDYPSNSRTSYFMIPNFGNYSRECKEKVWKKGSRMLQLKWRINHFYKMGPVTVC